MQRLTCLAVVLLLASAPAGAGAELVLRDGSRLNGTELERKPDQYLLTLENGSVLPVPVELVVELHLTGDDDPPASGLREAKGETLVGPPDGPEIPTHSQQLAALGEQRLKPAEDILPPEWRPTENWPGRQTSNEFNPARWSQGVFDSTWVPRSAFRQSGDVTEFNPARWYETPIDHSWWPRNAFGETVWFPSVLQPR